MPYGNDNNQPNTKDSPEEKRQKIIDEEVKEKEQLIEKIQDILVLREIAKSEIRSNVRRRLLLEEEKVLEKALLEEEKALEKRLLEEEKALEKRLLEEEKAEYKSKLEASERDKVVIENFARKVACPTRLRYSIETFPKNFVFSMDDMNRRISDLNTKMVAALDSSRRVTNLVNFVRQFASLTSKSEDDQNSKFPAVWKRLKSELPKLIKPQNPTDLQKIIIELYEAANESIAKQTWLNNVKVWKTKLGELTFEDLTTVKDLAFIGEEDIREKIEQGDFDKIFKNEYEKEYVLDLLKLRKIGTDLPSMYKICFWILHVSVDVEVEKLRKKISGEWPGEIRAVRYDYYCTKVVELYNLVSELSKHGPGLIPPLNCKPTITDFHEYLKQLSSIGGKSLAFVAETLYVNEE